MTHLRDEISVSCEFSQQCGQKYSVEEPVAASYDAFERPAHLCNHVLYLPSQTIASSPAQSLDASIMGPGKSDTYKIAVR